MKEVFTAERKVQGLTYHRFAGSFVILDFLFFKSLHIRLLRKTGGEGEVTETHTQQ